MPEIVFPFAVPVRVSMLPLGDPDCTVNWNFPVTLPLTFPLRVNDPVSESPDSKHGDDVEKLKFVTLNDWSPLTLSDVVKLKAVFVRVAVQLPLMLPELLEFPQATSTTISARVGAIANRFISSLYKAAISSECQFASH